MEEENQVNDVEARAAPVLDQRKIDAMNVKSLNTANRVYRQCVAGKCPPPIDPQQKHMQRLMAMKKKPKVFTSTKLQDKLLAKIWREKGRNHRMESLEKDLEELRTRIKVAKGKTHHEAQEANFKKIIKHLKDIESMDKQIKQENLEIAHLKSQIKRVEEKKVQMSRETEAEVQHADHLRRACRNLEIMEGKVHAARQRECALTKENEQLAELIANMVFDRKVFNAYWSKLVANLKDRRKFVLDMIERSNTAFNQGADILDNLKQIESRRISNRDYSIAEMYKIQGQIDGNHNMLEFLGGKGKRRGMAPLESREVRRREKFKEDYTSKLNLYSEIVANIKDFMKTKDISMAKDEFLRRENEGFQYYNFMNEINYQIEKFANAYIKGSENMRKIKSYSERKEEYYEKRLDELNKEHLEEIEKTQKAKEDIENAEKYVRHHFDALLEIMKILKCDVSSIQKKLGENKRITEFNVKEFFSVLEERISNILAYVYCSQRKARGILDDDLKLVIKSLKRDYEEPVQIDDVIGSAQQQCAECAESSNVNRYDEAIVYPLDHADILANVRKIVEAPEMVNRLHNLSKCNLPRSVIVASRRDAK